METMRTPLTPLRKRVQSAESLLRCDYGCGDRDIERIAQGKLVEMSANYEDEDFYRLLCKHYFEAMAELVKAEKEAMREAMNQ